MTTMEELARKMLKAREDYFCASARMRGLHVEWSQSCSDLAREMDNEGADCLVVDGNKVVVFELAYREEEDLPPSDAFSVFTPWKEPSE